MVTMDPLQVAEEVVESSPNKLEDIYRLLAEGSFPSSFCSIKKKNLKRYARKFTLEAGCLYYVGPKKEEKREVVVDPERRRHIFMESHLTESGHHLGQKKTVNRIQSRYYWLGVVKDVIDWIKICETCQNTEYHKNPSKKTKPVKADHPWQVLGTGLHGPFTQSSLQNTYILTVTDFFTKWTEAIALQGNDTISVAKALASIYYRYGAANYIYHSHSWDFCEEVSRRLCEKWNISQTLTSVDTSELTGLDEQTYEVLKSSIQTMVSNNPRDWDQHLEQALFQLRTSINTVTKYTPFFLMYNRDIQLSSGAEVPAIKKPNGSVSQNNEDFLCYTAGMQEQRDAVREMVLANISAASKSEERCVQRPKRSPPAVTFQGQDVLFRSGSSQPLKKFKHNHIMSFKFETVLLPEEHPSSTEETSQ